MVNDRAEHDPATLTSIVDRLAPEALASLMAVSQDGIAVLDENRRYLRVNPQGCSILGITHDAVLGRPAFSEETSGRHTKESQQHVSYMVTVRRHDDAGDERELACRESQVVAQGRSLSVVTFRDITEIRVQQRRITAFAVAASAVAYAGSLRATLDAICTEVVRTAGLAGAQILLIDPADLRLRVHGAAPELVFPEKFAVLLNEARQRGARLTSVEALRNRRPVITHNRKAQMLADPAWQPLHAHLRGFDWDTFVSVPLIVRDRALGGMNAYYRPGHGPDNEEIEFLTSMADQAAVAADNARLLDELKGKAELEERHRLARELHDSVCQELFSMNLHIRATKLALARGATIDEHDLSGRLTTLEELSHAALEDMRALVAELYPTLLHAEGLLVAIRQHAASITAREGVDVDLVARCDRVEIDSGAEIDAFRLLQEALNNVVKHSRATTARIYVGPDLADSQTLVLEVSDNGTGFDCSSVPAGRLGLASMRERAERLGGELSIRSAPHTGTTVRVEVPRALKPVAPDVDDLGPDS